MKRLVSLGLSFTLLLALVFGSILLSPTVINVALANDMSDAPMTKDTITAGSDGDDDDQGDNDQEDAPVTQDTITTGGGSEDDDDDDSGQNNNDKNNNDNNNNEPATETDNDDTAAALNFGDCEASADQDIVVSGLDGDETLTPVPTPATPIPLDQSKASLCPHEPEKGLFGADIPADNTATALSFGDFGESTATASQDIEVDQED